MIVVVELVLEVAEVTVLVVLVCEVTVVVVVPVVWDVTDVSVRVVNEVTVSVVVQVVKVEVEVKVVVVVVDVSVVERVVITKGTTIISDWTVGIFSRLAAAVIASAMSMANTSGSKAWI